MVCLWGAECRGLIAPKARQHGVCDAYDEASAEDSDGGGIANEARERAADGDGTGYDGGDEADLHVGFKFCGEFKEHFELVQGLVH